MASRVWVDLAVGEFCWRMVNVDLFESSHALLTSSANTLIWGTVLLEAVVLYEVLETCNMIEVVMFGGGDCTGWLVVRHVDDSLKFWKL